MENRKAKRTYGLKKIFLRDNNIDYEVILTDISSRGLCIKTEHVFPTFKVIDVIVTIENKSIQLKGSVRWVNEHPEKSKPNLKEIGILLINPPKKYLEYMERISK